MNQQRFTEVVPGVWLDNHTHMTVDRAKYIGQPSPMLEVGKEYPIGGFTFNNASGIYVQIGTIYEDGSFPEDGVPLADFILIPAKVTQDVGSDDVVDAVVPHTQVKASNPKEGVGSTRVPFHLIPGGPLAWVAMAFYEGGTKYGPYNWRVAGVRASTYVSAAMRHIEKWWNGHDTDPHTRVHHLANAIAGLMVVMDAEIQGMLNDDRPPKEDLEKLFEKLAAVQQHLTEMNKGMNPPNYTEIEHGRK